MPKNRIKTSSKFSVTDKSARKKKTINNLKKISIVILIISLVALFSLYTIKFLSYKPKISITNDGVNNLLIPRDEVSSTLFIFEAGNNTQITGAWYVIHNKKNAFTMVYYIPMGVYMKDYLGGVSSYVSVGELKYIGSRVNEKKSFEYVIWQLGNLTGIIPDSYIWMDLNSLTYFSKIFGDVSEFKKSDFSERYVDGEKLSTDSYTISSLLNKYDSTKLFLSFNINKQFINTIDTNLSLRKLMSVLHTNKAALESNDIYMMDLTQIWATALEKQISGKDINVANYSAIDERLKDVVVNLKGRELEREQVKVEIYNASNIEGLALRYSRKFRNSGLEVVRYENSPTLEEKTKIYIPKPDKYDHSLETAKKLISSDVEIIYSRPDFMTTGDIVVVIGSNIGKSLTWK